MTLDEKIDFLMAGFTSINDKLKGFATKADLMAINTEIQGLKESQA